MPLLLVVVLSSDWVDQPPHPCILAPLSPFSAFCPLPLLLSVQPLEYLGTAVSTGVMFMALAWVLFDFNDDPPSGGNFSSPRK